jgi:RNA polymerase sigma-70 factor (ECF subfamily)
MLAEVGGHRLARKTPLKNTPESGQNLLHRFPGLAPVLSQAIEPAEIAPGARNRAPPRNALLSVPSPCNLTICWYASIVEQAARILRRMLVEFELIQKAQKGDDAAFNQVVVAYRKRILGTIARLIGRPEDVEDVAQEVFLRLYYSLDQLRTPEVFEPWLYRLTVNASYDYLRKQRRRNEARMSDLSEQQVMMADAAAGGKVSGEEQHRKQVKELVDSLLQSVSEQDRILLTLKEVEGLSLKELEKIYSVNENALKVRLFRARQRVLNAYQASQKGKAGKARE